MSKRKISERSENIKDSIMMLLISAHGYDAPIEKTYRNLGDKIRNSLIVMSIYFGNKTNTTDPELNKRLTQYVENMMTTLEQMDTFYTPAMNVKDTSAPMCETITIGDEEVFLKGKPMSTRDIYILKFILDCKNFIESNAEITKEQFKEFVTYHSRNQRKLFFYLNADDYINILDAFKSRDDIMDIKNIFLEQTYIFSDSWKHEYLSLCCSKTDLTDFRHFDAKQMTIDDIQFDPLSATIFKTYRSHPNSQLRQQTNLFLEQKWEHISSLCESKPGEKNIYKFSLQFITPDCYRKTFNESNIFSNFDLNSSDQSIFRCLNEKLSTLGDPPELTEFKRFIFKSITEDIIKTMLISQTQIFMILQLFNLKAAFITDSDCTNISEGVDFDADIKPKKRIRNQNPEDSQRDYMQEGESIVISEILHNHEVDCKHIIMETVHTLCPSFGLMFKKIKSLREQMYDAMNPNVLIRAFNFIKRKIASSISPNEIIIRNKIQSELFKSDRKSRRHHSSRGTRGIKKNSFIEKNAREIKQKLKNVDQIYGQFH
jgi:hypothetical protein